MDKDKEINRRIGSINYHAAEAFKKTLRLVTANVYRDGKNYRLYLSGRLFGTFNYETTIALLDGTISILQYLSTEE